MPNPEQIQHTPRLSRNQEHTDIEKKIIPSEEWAWMLGVIAGKGHVSSGGYIKFFNPSRELLEAVKSRGETLFNTNSQLKIFSEPYRNPALIFNNRSLSRELGIFTRDRWVETIMTKHSWILQNERYIWKLLEGIFETKGLFRRASNKYEEIYINIIFPNVGNFLAELLVKVGVENPKIIPRRKGNGIHVIKITAPKDIKLFSENVHSVIPKKEERLTFFRESMQTKRVVNKPSTEDDVIKEWIRVKAILITPTPYSISRLRKLGLTLYSVNVYTRLFGIHRGKRSFNVVREALERIIIEKGISADLDESNIKVARELFEASRNKREPRRTHQNYHTDEDVIQEWIRVRSLLRYVPNSMDFIQLRKQKQTKYSHALYSLRFGDNDFTTARDTLEKIAREREEEALPYKNQNKFSEDDLINEWYRITEILGHIPNYTDIRRLLKTGTTKYSATVYVKRFGDGSFVKAKENLDKLAFGKETNNLLEQYEYTSGKQIKFVPKIHRPSEKEDKRRLNQITGYTHQVSTPQVLYGHDGESIIFPSLKIEDIRSGQRYTIDPVTKLIVLKEPDKNKPTSQEIQLFP